MLARHMVGEGPRAVVMLHGFLGSGRNLRSVARRWSDRDPERRFVLPDLTGHGDSPPLPEGADMATLAADVLSLAGHELAGEPFELVGHSLGGRVALAAVDAGGGDVRSVTLLDITPGPLGDASRDVTAVLEVLGAAPERSADRQSMGAYLTGAGLSRTLSDWLLTNLQHDGDGWRWRFDRSALARLFSRTVVTDLWHVVREGRVPVRCVRGAQSALVTDQRAAEMVAAGVPVWTVPEAGHFLHVQQPDALVEILVRESGGRAS